MRRSPRRPLILKRRKLPFHQNATDSQPGESGSKEPSKPAAAQSFPDGIRIMDHPSKSDTQVVVIPEKANLQSVIGALTAKGKECGAQGPNKFILLNGGGSGNKWDFGLDSQSAAEAAATKSTEGHTVKDVNCGPLDDSLTNIQWLGKMSTCALEPNSTKQLSSKENQKPLSQTFQVHVEAPQQPISERPPYSYMAMIQFAINSRKNRRMTLKEIYMWIEDNFPYYRDVAKPGWKNSIRHNLSLHDMFIRETSPDGKMSFWTIRPEANRCLTLDHVYKHQKRTLPDKNTDFKVEVKEELVCVPIKCETPKAPPKRQASSSRRKQRLVLSVNEEPVLLCNKSNFFDSGVDSDASTFQDNPHIELDEDKHGQESPDREFSFKTPIKSSSHLTSSTPSKPPSYVASFKVTPVDKGSQNILHLSPIRTTGGPTVTPQHDYTTFSFSSTPFKDLPLFNSPRELLTSSPTECLKKGLVLDTMNDSLSKILLDVSFSGLDDDDFGMANISWSDLIPQLK
uniref:Forkhead box protein M1 n=1 Tax=Neolamprologus brichardi TaxID=32507 RepID=A0A3Q4H0V1_NEOBR